MSRYVLTLVDHLQDVVAGTPAPSRPQQLLDALPSEPSIAHPMTPHLNTAPGSQPTNTQRLNSNQASNASSLNAESSQASISGSVQSDRANSDAPEASTSAPQGDSPKACWSQVAASTEADHGSQHGSAGTGPRATSPSGRPVAPPGAAGRGQGRPMQVPRSGSGASAATQDSGSEYARTDSAGSLRDANVSDRRASGATAGTSSSLPRDSSASSFTSAPHKRSSGRCAT